MGAFEPWLLPLLVFVGSPIAGVILRSALIGRLRAMAARSSSKLDDLLLEIVARDFPLWMFLSGTAGAAGIAPGLTSLQSHVIQKLVVIGFIASISMAASKFAAGLIRLYAERGEAVAGTSSLTENLARMVIVALGVLLVLANLGISITPLLTALGIGSLAVALALQETLSNLFAGIHIVASRKVDVGDFVRLETGEEGVVVDVGYRTTRLRGADDNYVLVPNSKISQGTIVNFSHPTLALAAVATFPLAVGADLERVEELALETALEVRSKTPAALADVAPWVRFLAVRDGAVILMVRLDARSFDVRGLVVHELIKRVATRLREEGIALVTAPSWTKEQSGEGRVPRH